MKWTEDSALYQVQYGASATERTESAFDYLLSVINSANAEVMKAVSRGLLQIVSDYSNEVR